MKRKVSLLVLVSFLAVGLALTGCGRRGSSSQTVSQLPSGSDDASATAEAASAESATATEAPPAALVEPEPEPEPEPAPEPVETTVTASGQCNFDFDKWDLKSGEVARIDHMMVRVTPETVQDVSIDGHCDEIGTHPYNDDLGMKRARAVQGYLNQTYGIPLAKIRCTSHGKRQPVATNATESGRAQNRRTEVVVTYTKRQS